MGHEQEAATGKPEAMAHDSSRPVLVALAICCTVPMIGIVVMTSVLGVTLGWAAAIAIGVVAAAVCVAVMAQHQRSRHHPRNHGASSHPDL